MAKKSAIAKNIRRKALNKRFAKKRSELKEIVMDKKLSIAERFQAQIKLAELPANSAKVRIRNRCFLTGRPRGFYRDFGLSRIALRENAGFALIPGITKSSW